MFGLAPLLSTALNGAGGVIEDPEQGIVDDRLTNASNSSVSFRFIITIIDRQRQIARK